MTIYLGKSCSFCLPLVPFINCRHFMYLVISLLVLRAGYGIWLYQFLIIAYLFTFYRTSSWNSSCFPPWRSRDYSFRSAGKCDSENRGWRGCWDKNQLKSAKNIVHSVLSWVSFKSEVWNYVYKMPKYVLSLDARKVKKKKKKKKQTRVPFLRYRMRLPCFRGKGQTQRVAAFWHHKSIDKTGVTTCMHHTTPYSTR